MAQKSPLNFLYFLKLVGKDLGLSTHHSDVLLCQLSAVSHGSTQTTLPLGGFMAV
jgi:hypothetical protein